MQVNISTGFTKASLNREARDQGLSHRDELKTLAKQVPWQSVRLGEFPSFQADCPGLVLCGFVDNYLLVPDSTGILETPTLPG